MSEDPTLPAESVSPAESTETAPAGRRKPLTPAQWYEIRTKAELGTARVSELAREYGISSSAVSQHLKDHKIVVGARASEVTEEIAKATAAKVAAAVAPFAEKRAERLEETREFYYTAHSTIDKVILSKIIEQVKARRPIAEIGADLKALNFAKRSLMVGRSERFAVLDADSHVDVASLPDLIVQDLTAEEIASIQKGDDPLDELEDALAAADEVV